MKVFFSQYFDENILKNIELVVQKRTDITPKIEQVMMIMNILTQPKEK